MRQTNLLQNTKGIVLGLVTHEEKAIDLHNSARQRLRGRGHNVGVARVVPNHGLVFTFGSLPGILRKCGLGAGIAEYAKVHTTERNTRIKGRRAKFLCCEPTSTHRKKKKKGNKLTQKQR